MSMRGKSDFHSGSDRTTRMSENNGVLKSWPGSPGSVSLQPLLGKMPLQSLLTMCPSEELRASFEYSVKRQTRLRISFSFFFRLCLEVECRSESPFYYACVMRTWASILGRRFLLGYLCTKPISTCVPWVYIYIFMYWHAYVLIMKEIEKEAHWFAYR